MFKFNLGDKLMYDDVAIEYLRKKYDNREREMRSINKARFIVMSIDMNKGIYHLKDSYGDIIRCDKNAVEKNCIRIIKVL